MKRSRSSYLSHFDLLQIRTRLNAQYHTRFEIMSPDRLQSALAAPRHEFFGQAMFPSVWNKSARLLEALIRNHPFFDGNKRIAFAAVTEFLDRNGYVLTAAAADATSLTRSIALRQIDVAAIEAWLQAHATPAA